MKEAPAIGRLPQDEAMEPLSDREKVSHVLARFAYGPRLGQFDQVLEMGVDAWLDDQLQQKVPTDPRLRSLLEDYETLGLSLAECAEFTAPTRERGVEPSAEERRAENQRKRIPVNELVWSTALRAVYSDRQATEVMADFWRNHFNVSFTKGQRIFNKVPDYDRSVIRANVWGDFPTMLKASATHPAMLEYLDNHLSRRPPTEQELKELERRTKRQTGSRQRAEEAAQIAAQRGLNENYARELLELHTLGVDNYYKQKDVIALAEVLTGWTYDGGQNGTQEFKFRKNMHVSGDKKVLGKRFKEDKEGGHGQGLEVIEMLAGHKGTSQFLAMKLVRYLVADVPPESMVSAVAKTYRKTDGDLQAMVRTIIDHDEFWSRAHFRSKFKTPIEFMVSAMRITGAEAEPDAGLGSYLQEMGQPIFQCDDPTGYYDTADAWLDPGVMALRWEFATDLASGRIRGAKIPDLFYEQVPYDQPPRMWQHHLTRLILPGGAGERTRAALASVTSEYLGRKKRTPDLFELGPLLVGLLLGSPEFQQQ